MNNDDFKRDLAEVINRHCVEALSDTPDFILADYLAGCLEAFAYTTRARDKWYEPGIACPNND
jgi:hypothetical protein